LPSVAKKRIVYVVNHAAFFVSHRLPIAIAAKQAGHEVRLLTGQAGCGEMEKAAVAALRAVGISHHRAMFSSSGTNPIFELFGLIQLIWFLWRCKPDVVHCASPKGVLYGGIAARVCGARGLVLAITGMGYAYTQHSGTSRLRSVVKLVCGALAKIAFGHQNKRVIVQNHDDYQMVIAKGIAKPCELILIPGSGVDLSLYQDCDPTNKTKTILFPARMLRDKGVEEFVEAARLLKSSLPNWVFVLAGAAGYDNPSAISEEELKQWQAESNVRWLGHVSDMTPLFRKAAIVCLPSYREGMPKALLEAAAAGCAVITSDAVGCREAIVPGVTGDLVPIRDSCALTTAMFSLVKDEWRRQAYGFNGQQRAIARFSLNAVINQTLKIYQEVSEHDGIAQASHLVRTQRD